MENDSMSMTIKELIQISYQTAKEKGWWEKDRPFSEGIALMHSELSEALEEWRKHGMDPSLMIYGDESDIPHEFPVKPEGIAVELADVMIRIADWCGRCDIPLEQAIKFKLDYNISRSHRHGGKLA